MSDLKKDNVSKMTILELGMESDFWRVLCEGLDNSIAGFKKELESDEDIDQLPSAEYKQARQLLKAKRLFLEELKQSPKNLMSWLKTDHEPEESFDPYAKE